ncbi:MAG: bifunctional lysine ketoglutarate reductase /saccharopine dehydrogenase family protein [Thermoplasmata archaeon]
MSIAHGGRALVARIGIRREDINRRERRAPLTPQDVRWLISEHGLEVIVEDSSLRVYTNEEYVRAGARVEKSLKECPVIFAIKEIPVSELEEGKTYIFFAHVIKGQEHNMPMLRRLMDLKCQLIDYERIVDNRGRRLIFFGRHAGLAGVIETLWALGQRLQWEGLATPFLNLRHAFDYDNLTAAKRALRELGNLVSRDGLPESLSPFIIGVTGYGNVAGGVWEMLRELPVKELSPDEIEEGLKAPSRHSIYAVTFKEEHMVEPVEPGRKFELQDYYQHPEKYRPRFERYLPHLTVLLNCIYWDARYPRLVTREYLRREGQHRLRVVGDISCDIRGSIEFTYKATEPDSPVFVYDPESDTIRDGVEGNGVVVMAVYNLPCEFPKESSESFSAALRPFVPEIAKADYSASFERIALQPTLKNAMILHKGELTPPYRYIAKFLEKR